MNDFYTLYKQDIVNAFYAWRRAAAENNWNLADSANLSDEELAELDCKTFLEFAKK